MKWLTQRLDQSRLSGRYGQAHSASGANAPRPTTLIETAKFSNVDAQVWLADRPTMLPTGSGDC